MKMWTLLLVTLVAQLSWGQDLSEKRKNFYEKVGSCGQAVFSDNEWFATSLPNTSNGIGHVRIQSLIDDAKTVDFPADDTVVDVKVANGNVYVLTETTFEAWDIANYKQLFKYASMPTIDKNSHWSQKSSGFILDGNTAIIAHGTMGISILNLKSGVALKTVPMLSNSSAQDITLLDPRTAIVAVDNGDEGAFRGIYLLDLVSLTIKNQIKIDNAYPLSVRVLPNNRLMMGYLNAIWKFDLNAALTSKEASPNRRSWRFPNLPNVDMRGKAFYDDKYLYSCFYWVNSYNSSGYGMTSPHPLVFKLDDLQLN